MSTPAIITLVGYGVLLLMSARMHGEVPRAKINFWVNLVRTSLTLGLLYWGGFFS